MDDRNIRRFERATRVQTFGRDPDKLAAWKSASRTERPAKKAGTPVTPPPVA